LTGAERKIGGKKEAFSGGHERLQQLFGEAKIANANAGRPEKTPILSRFSRTSAVKKGALSFSWKLKTPSSVFENCYIAVALLACFQAERPRLLITIIILLFLRCVNNFPASAALIAEKISAA
jgi:hypothetical protein